MTLANRYRRRTPDQTLKFKLLWNKVSLHQNELGLIATLATIAGYMFWAAPAILATATFMGIMAVAFGLLNKSAHAFTGWGLPIKGWHLASAVVATAAVAGMSGIDPVSAQMFNNLETAVNDAIGNTAGTTIDEATITTIFNIFRILIVLAFLIGVVIVFTQATRGGDWQPIANLLAIGVAFVIGVEVISTLIIGGGGGGAAGG